MAWQNERLSKDPFEGRFWLVVQKQCKWPEVNQKSNMADQIARKIQKIASKPGLLMFASAAITLRSKVNTLLTSTGQRWRRNQFYFCCRGLNDMTNGWISSNYSKVMPSLTRQEWRLWGSKMFARSATQQQSMSRFKKCKTLCESPSQKKNTLHLVVQVNTNPILYLQVCYK